MLFNVGVLTLKFRRQNSQCPMATNELLYMLVHACACMMQGDWKLAAWGKAVVFLIIQPKNVISCLQHFVNNRSLEYKRESL